MKRVIFFAFLLFLWACQTHNVEEKDLNYLNGYWEISEVVMTDGSKKEYNVNPTIDFIKLENGKGFRRKLKPNFNGTYDASNQDVEMLTITKKDETFIMAYDNEFSHWEEMLVEIDTLYFSVINQEGTTYTYKRFEPIAIPK